jgi:hypothetical protein
MDNTHNIDNIHNIDNTHNIPSVSRQKSFIIENSYILNKHNKHTIINIVLTDIGKESIIETSDIEVNINLDIVEKINSKTLLQIYNIVKSRLDFLNS